MLDIRVTERGHEVWLLTPDGWRLIRNSEIAYPPGSPGFVRAVMEKLRRMR